MGNLDKNLGRDSDAPGIHRFSLGDIQIVVVPDGHRTFPLPENFVLNASREQLNQALAAASMPPDIMTIVFNPIVVQTGGKTILFDTGNGPQPAGTVSTVGRLPESLAAAGIAPESIDRIVITHFHGDHVNGLKTADGQPAFANAEIFVPAVEWNFWMDDAEMERASTPRMQDLFRNTRRIFGDLAPRLSQYGDGQDVAPGIAAVSTPGHSIGHSSFIASSAGKSLFIQADVTNHPALFVAHPSWHAMFDQNPAQAEETRRRTYEMLVTERLPVQGFHHPLPSVSHVERHGDGYRLLPILTNSI